MSPESALLVSDAGMRLDLLTGPAMTPQGLVPGASFFSGFVDRPDIAAGGLLAVADVAGSRYADPGLAQRLASMDPVVTAGGDRLRFESFSLCNGVHARFDLLRDGLGSSEVGFGTTNVDVNQPLRTALARIDRTDPLHLAVGADQLRASSLAATYLEPKVPLPDRWVRGLAETSQLLSEMEPVASLRGAETRRFFAGLSRVAVARTRGPRASVAKGLAHHDPAGAGSLPLAGTTRLRGSDRILRFTEQLTVHRHRHGSTAWVFTVPGGRLTLALSPGPYRGFSGEGTLLGLLTHPEAEQAGRRILTELGWASVIDPAAHAAATNLNAADVRAGLGWLSASGRLGYDLDERAWFHRELPVDSDAVQRRNPRLVAAQKLLDSDGVAVGSAPGVWRVRGSRGAAHTVSSGPCCTCPWESEHRGTRGPCKHVLAVLLMLRK